MKRFNLITTATVSAVLLSSAVWVSATDSGDPRSRTRKPRTERSAKPRKVSQKRAPIMGGAAGDKQLYGFCWAASYGGPLLDYMGPAAIDASGNHVAVTDTYFPHTTACYHDGKMMVVRNTDDSETVTYTDYDATTWEQVGTSISLTKNNENILPGCMTYDPQTKKMFACFFQSATDYGMTDCVQFGYLNTSDPFNYTNLVGTMSVGARAMAAAGDGTMYIIGTDGKLYTVNKQNAELTELGAINLPQYEGDPWQSWNWMHEGATVDWETGLIYFNYADSEGDTFIVTIDPTTLAVKKVADFGYWSGGTEMTEQFSALYFIQSAAAEQTGTPADVTDFAVTPVGVSAAGHIKFTMPAVSTEGDSLTADLSWSVSDGTSVLGSGSAAPGSVVEADIPTGDKTGKINFGLTVSNGELAGTPVNQIVYIGPDTPMLFNAPVAMADGNTVTIAWEEMEAVNGGNLDTPQRYRVVRNPGEVVVNEGVEGTECTDQLPEFKAAYTYTVYPLAGEMTGEGRSTRELLAGTLLGLPHYDNFTSEMWFRGYPVIDNNHDNNTWWIDTKRKAAVYSSVNIAADDYLLVGPVRCKAGSLYTMAMTADGHSTNECVAAYVGTDPADVSTFSYNIIPDSWVNPSVGSRKLEGSFSPETDGLYYFAIKAASPARMTNLYIYDVRIDEVGPACPNAPAAVSARAEDASSITLGFTLPATTIGGDATELTAVRIYRDNEQIAELTEGVAAGAAMTYRDTNPGSHGLHSYRVVAINAAGAGEAATVEGYAGLDIPASPTNLRIVEDLNQFGLIHLTWDAPTAGLHGGYIDPTQLTYHVNYTSSNHGIGEVTAGSDNRYDLVINNVASQGIIAASVYASNATGGERTSWVTSSCYYGPALSLPLRESWPNCTQRSGQWLGQSLVERPALFESFWEVNDGSRTGKVAQDKDGGMLLVTTTVPGRGQRMLSPRIDISKVAHPTLVFYHYYTTDIQDFEVGVIVDDQPVQTVRALDLPESGANQWYRVEIPLDTYKNSKYINVAFTGRAKVAAEEFACVDNVSITDFVSNDLMVTDFTVPVKTDINKAITATLTIRNAGSVKVPGADYTVSLFKNGAKIAELQCQDIEADATSMYYIQDTPTVTDPATCEYYAVINFSRDGNTANNTSATRSCRIVTPDYPRVTDLQAVNDGGIKLSWSDPDASDMPATPTTDSFEDYAAFSIANLGNWTLHDGDGQPTVVLELPMVGVLDYPNIGQPMAWQVIDPVAANLFNSAWTPRTGKNMLVSFQACLNGSRNTASDDWLISPELNGKATNLSFYARAGMKAYAPEILDIMYSTKSNAPADFVPLKQNVEVGYTTDWTEFVYQLPEGARYFAIVHKSINKLAVLLDDITYTAAGSVAESLELQGFNIYRDGRKINTELVTDNEYLDSEIAEGATGTYNVTAVWDKGESGLSNTVVLVANSLNSIGTYKLEITGRNGMIHVEGGIGENVSVFNTTGLLIAKRAVEGSADIAVPGPGIYLVRAGNTTVKLIVR